MTVEDLLNVVLDLKRKRIPVSKLAAERQRREGPCWKLAHRGKALSQRDVTRRRLAKGMGIAAPGGAASLFKGMSHAIALRPWLLTLPQATRAAIEEPPKAGED